VQAAGRTGNGAGKRTGNKRRERQRMKIPEINKSRTNAEEKREDMRKRMQQNRVQRGAAEKRESKTGT